MSEQAQESPGTAVGAAPAVELTPDAAQAEITRLTGDKDFQKDLLSGFGIGHRAALEKWQGLQKTAFGGGGTASPEERAMGDALRPPASPAEYKITRDLSLADWSEDLESEAKTLSHAIGLPQGALEGVVMAWNHAAATINRDGPISPEKEAAQYETGMQALKAKHGARAGEVLEKANSVIRNLPAEQRQRVKDLLNSSGLANSPYLVDQLAMVADRKAPR